MSNAVLGSRSRYSTVSPPPPYIKDLLPSEEPESIQKALNDAVARAERAERAYADVASSLYSICARLPEALRLQMAYSLRFADAQDAFAGFLSTALHTPVTPASFTFLRYPYALPEPPIAEAFSALHLASGIGLRQGSDHLRQSSQQIPSFRTLLRSLQLSATGFSMSAAVVVPTKRRSRSSEGLIEGRRVTVCSLCRSKMRHISDCDTPGSVSTSQEVQVIANSQSRITLAHSAGQSQHVLVDRARSTARLDLLFVNQMKSQMLDPRPVGHYGEHERDQESQAGSSCWHPGTSVSAYRSAVASERLHRPEFAHLSQGQAYPSAATNMDASGLASQAVHRRPPTPPYIYTREQYANDSSSRTLPHQHSQSYTRSVVAVTGGSIGSCDSSEEEEDASLDSKGEGEGEGVKETVWVKESDLGIDTEIVRAANGSSSHTRRVLASTTS
ncbi:hypothetical protein DFH11DRAFT_1731518 [Phellopilus nigrolimitatus]|nr:hypothetical protein DFH11DRAFT_1731518 [Phellopilus nigrolimitatus]